MIAQGLAEIGDEALFENLVLRGLLDA